MADWNSRLVVKFTVDEVQEIIQPIDNFTPKIDTPHDVIDSIDAENIGFEAKSRRFTFDFTAKALNVDVMRNMLSAAKNRTEFSIDIEEQDENDQWAFNSVAFPNCRFTNVSPSDISNDGSAPVMTFSGICLDVTFETDEGTI